MSEKFNHEAITLTTTTRSYCSIQRYVQGPDEIYNIFKFGSRYGSNFYFIIDKGVYDLIKNKIDSIQDTCGCSFAYRCFIGESCRENVEQLAAEVREGGYDVVLGIGGGKVLDTVKLVGDEADVAKIIVPTSAASDAPAADWAVYYTKEGVFVTGLATRRSTELVLVDSRIVASAPARLFAAGVADALVTWFEAEANRKAMTPNYAYGGYNATLAGAAIARECFDTLVEKSIPAYEAVKEKILTPAVEDVIEANTLLSGMGFMNAGCAAAHAIHNGISELPNGESHLHGEKVAFGLVCEMVLENTPQELFNRMLDILYGLNLPITLEQLDLTADEETLDVIVNHVTNKSFLIYREPTEITPAVVRDVILAADMYGRNYLKSKKNGQ